LLFLVPGTTFAVLIKAAINGEFKTIWEYDEEKLLAEEEAKLLEASTTEGEMKELNSKTQKVD